jgi:hypothetical protein
MAKIIRHWKTGDTYEFDAPPPVNAHCDDCGSRLLPLDPELRGYEPNEGWLGNRDYSEPYDYDEGFDAGEWNNHPVEG